jgi:hypothetical protein
MSDFVLTFNAVAGQAIPILISGASSLHILSLHSPIASAVGIGVVVELIKLKAPYLLLWLGRKNPF